MKNIKLAIIAAAFALLTATGFAAPAAPAQTYEFTANLDFTTIYNGSTITLQGTGPTADIMLTDYNLVGWSGGTVTPMNSSPSFQSFSFYDASTFYGSFDISGFSMAGEFFFGSNSPVDGGFLQVESDPPGVWRPVAAGVPDNGTTLMLFAMALSGLAAVRRRTCARA